MQVLIDSYTAYAAYSSGSANATVNNAQDAETPISSIIFELDPPDVPYLNEVQLGLLREYKTLPDNWDGEGAKAPDRLALMHASYLVKVLQAFGQKVFHVSPGPSGEISIDIRNSNKNRALEILFYPDKAKFVLFPESGRPDQGVFELASLQSLIKWLNA